MVADVSSGITGQIVHPSVSGIHHVTVIAGDAQANVDFYVGLLGLRLVKKTVNQDMPHTYHLFYADAVGTPGTDLTFFSWPDMPPARAGAGLASEVTLALAEGSLPFWRDRLADHGVETHEPEARFGEDVLPFSDPHGLALALVESKNERPWTPWSGSSVPEAHQIRGVHSVRMRVRSLGATKDLLVNALGFREASVDDGWHRLEVSSGGSGCLVDILEVRDERLGRWGTGAIHHVAWIAGDAEEELTLRDRVVESGLRPTEVIDRFWFRSVYFKEPGGVLFELATEGPGFARDEAIDHLGEQLILPPWLEEQRAEIEAALPDIVVPSP